MRFLTDYINGDVYFAINNFIVFNQTVINGSVYDFGDAGKMIGNLGSIEAITYQGDKMLVLGLKAGQTKATVTGSRTDKFVITVREAANGNGWL